MPEKNWPNSDLPGLPMFPERDGWHMLDRDVWQWSAKRKAWNDTVLHPNFVLPKNMAWRKYYGPVFSPTQINEMLAAERERIKSMVTRACNLGNIITVLQRDMIIAGIDSETAIRNLGAAP